MTNFYWLIILYPLISAGVSFMLNKISIFKAIKDEYYLFAGFCLVYFGIFILIFAGFHKPPSAFIIFLVFSILYFLISVVRKIVWTGSKDIFAAVKGQS